MLLVRHVQAMTAPKLTAAEAIAEMRGMAQVTATWKHPKWALDQWADAIEAELAGKSAEIVWLTHAKNGWRHTSATKDARIKELEAERDYRRPCRCDNASGHEDTVNICCDCGGYRP